MVMVKVMATCDDDQVLNLKKEEREKQKSRKSR